MKGFVANTDWEWYDALRSAGSEGEVNFWRAGADASFRALRPGEPFFFKLKVPHNAVAGFGWFAHFSQLPCSVAWTLFGRANGCDDLVIFTERLLRHRTRVGMPAMAKSDYPVGCILIVDPVFFDDDDWIRVPADFGSHVGQGKRYPVDKGEGRRLLKDCLTRARAKSRSDRIAEESVAYGSSLSPRPRLGPLSSAAAVFDAYDRRCAVTGESALAALTAVRIRELPGAAGFPVSNAILLRADLARLFDAGYLTITPELFVSVSAPLRKASDDYAALDGRPARLPRDTSLRPMVESLWWHNETRFLGRD